MIYTITFNPSLDYIMHIKELTLDETNRSYEETIVAGGKGINVSTVLTTLGITNKALGFVAGFTGEEIEKEVQRRGVSCDFIHLKKGISRINVKLKHGEETEINGVGPLLDQEVLQQLFHKLEALKKDDWLIISGSIPSSLSHDIYEKIMKEVEGKQIHVIVDATKDLLRRVLPYQPFLIKPNLSEIEELFNVQIHNQEQLYHYGKKLQQEGAMNVLISCGNKGAILLDETGKRYACQAIKGKTINSVGAGDSMVAGFLAGYLKHHNYEEALQLGSASGSATAFQEGLATKEQIEKILLKQGKEN